MSTLLNRLTLLVSFAFSALCLQAADKKPFGLMTDLIEHTGQTWQNGYASNLPVWQLEEAIEPLQYAANVIGKSSTVLMTALPISSTRVVAITPCMIYSFPYS